MPLNDRELSYAQVTLADALAYLRAYEALGVPPPMGINRLHACLDALRELLVILHRNPNAKV